MRRATPPHAPSPRPLLVARAREQYFAAWRWRRAVERQLRGLGLTFTQWLVLEATDELVRDGGDAVNQRAIAEGAELDAMTVSQVMKTLEEKALVTRQPDVTGRAYRVFLTKKGEKLLQATVACVEAGTRATE
jgi:DNA-binding MarR family transcriptional regulator